MRRQRRAGSRIMCTVTVVPHEQGVRLLCNRDEQRTRPPGLPPKIHDLSGQRALFPRDPQRGGTWVGTNDAGLIVALLNLRPTAWRTSSEPNLSRGLIVLELLRCGDLQQAIRVAAALDGGLFEPFRAVVVHARGLAVATSLGTGTIHCTQRLLDAPVLFTSSSLGDAVVVPPRQRLFEHLVLQGGPDCWLDGQGRFHDHRWSDRPEISVRMERQDALTVSRTQIDVTEDSRHLRYEAPVNVDPLQVYPWCSLH
jgi:hypothetical protein